MVAIRKKDKALKIAERVMKGKGVKVQKPNSQKQKSLQTPYLQHQMGYMKKKEVKKTMKHADMKEDKKLFASMMKKAVKKGSARGK